MGKAAVPPNSNLPNERGVSKPTQAVAII